MTQKAILIFVKVPKEGTVKTRLAQGSCLNDRDVTLIAEAMLKDTIILASESNADIIEIGYYPESDLISLKKLLDPVIIRNSISQEITYYLQEGANFDERFGSVVSSSLMKGEKNLIILGADLPHLDHKVLDKAFDQLGSIRKEDLVILGPSNGGGIYLVGINNKFNPRWFSEYNLFRGGIEISQFVQLCTNKKLQLYLTPAYGDIDLEEDLVSLIMYIEALSVSSKFKGYHYPRFTANILKELGLYVIEKKAETRRRKIAKK